MKKILQISNYYYPHLGGIEQVTRDIVNTLSLREDIEQKVICFNETAKDDTYNNSREVTTTEIIDNIEIIRCGCITKLASQSISLSFPKQLKTVMESFQPDIVIFHYPNPYQAAFLFSYLKKPITFILYWHLDITKQIILKNLFYHQTIHLLERADQIVTTSPIYLDSSPFLSRYKSKCVIIPNCICESRLQVNDIVKERSLQIRRNNEGKIICFGIGRHVPYKGFEYLILASKLLDDNFKIFIGGEGPLTNSLKNAAKDDKKIVFLGRMSNEDLLSYFLAMDIFCFPSITKNEAFGIALAEGMYFGKPVVTFHIPGSGVNYVSLNGITGVECANRDIQEYADAIKILANDANLRNKMGKNAKARISELFLFSQFQTNILNLIFSDNSDL